MTSKNKLKTAPVENRRFSQSVHYPELASAPQQECLQPSMNCNCGTSAVEKLQLRHLHQSTVWTTTTGMSTTIDVRNYGLELEVHVHPTPPCQQTKGHRTHAISYTAHKAMNSGRLRVTVPSARTPKAAAIRSGQSGTNHHGHPESLLFLAPLFLPPDPVVLKVLELAHCIVPLNGLIMAPRKP